MPAIRAVVRTGLYRGLEVFGIVRGYNGMIEDDIYQMNSRSVANIIQRGWHYFKNCPQQRFSH
jgi:6-phosphofructokinase 1